MDKEIQDIIEVMEGDISDVSYEVPKDLKSRSVFLRNTPHGDIMVSKVLFPRCGSISYFEIVVFFQPPQGEPTILDRSAPMNIHGEEFKEWLDGAISLIRDGGYDTFVGRLQTSDRV